MPDGAVSTIFGRVEGDYGPDDRNKVGLTLYVRTPEGREKQIGSVARVRQNSLNPDKSFKEVVDQVKEDALAMLEIIQELETKMNEMTAKAGQLQ